VPRGGEARRGAAGFWCGGETAGGTLAVPQGWGSVVCDGVEERGYYGVGKGAMGATGWRNGGATW
jgi:hypothetical protein